MIALSNNNYTEVESVVLQSLLRYLKHKKWYTNYRAAYFKQNVDMYAIKRCINSKDARSFIDRTLCWDETPQGHSYWIQKYEIAFNELRDVINYGFGLTKSNMIDKLKQTFQNAVKQGMLS